MKCTICGSSNLVHVENIVYSTGRKARIYKCKDCGAYIRVEH